jgi:seryl-tRNA synthetase
LNIKVKNEDDSKDFVHMNDATAIAIGRVLIAIMENYQQADGSIQIPEVLIPYMNGKTVISKS